MTLKVPSSKNHTAFSTTSLIAPFPLHVLSHLSLTSFLILSRTQRAEISSPHVCPERKSSSINLFKMLGKGKVFSSCRKMHIISMCQDSLSGFQGLRVNVTLIESSVPIYFSVIGQTQLCRIDYA